MNISKTIKIWTVGLLAGMVAVSCGDSSGYIPPQYSSSSCTDISHYDYWAGDCMGQVVLQQEEQVLDTLTECAATFGNYTNRTFAVKNFPVRLFSYLLNDNLQWHDIVNQCTDTKDLSFIYEMYEYRVYNQKDTSKEHNHNFRISSKYKETLDVDVNGRRCRFVFEGKPLVTYRDGGAPSDWDGVSLELIYVIDTETNDTTEIRSSDTDVKLVIRPRGKDTYF